LARGWCPPKLYEFPRFGDTHGPKPYRSVRFGDIRGPKPYQFMRFGDTHDHKTYKFTRFGDVLWTPGTPIWPPVLGRARPQDGGGSSERPRGVGRGSAAPSDKMEAHTKKRCLCTGLSPDPPTKTAHNRLPTTYIRALSGPRTAPTSYALSPAHKITNGHQHDANFDDSPFESAQAGVQTV
jgi:hypothetical protein